MNKFDKIIKESGLLETKVLSHIESEAYKLNNYISILSQFGIPVKYHFEILERFPEVAFAILKGEGKRMKYEASNLDKTSDSARFRNVVDFIKTTSLSQKIKDNYFYELQKKVERGIKGNENEVINKSRERLFKLLEDMTDKEKPKVEIEYSEDERKIREAQTKVEGEDVLE